MPNKKVEDEPNFCGLSKYLNFTKKQFFSILGMFVAFITLIWVFVLFLV
jgi:hypothetical protein